jgi:chemotaxis protein CheZ
MNSVDDVDLEALFDEVAAQRVVELTSTPASTPARGPAASPLPSAAHADGAHCAEREPDEDMFERIGRLTRNVHNALRDLGYDKTFEKMVDASADTRTRLSYVSDLTRQAAERVLGAIEAAKPIQQALGSEALELHAKWERVIAGQSNVDEFRELALRTNQFLSSTGERAEQTGEHLLNIMMAQDFHDLTGQVIKRIVGLAEQLEGELVGFLVDARPRDAAGATADAHGLSGPVIAELGGSDTVRNQAQVDDLLAELGF